MEKFSVEEIVSLLNQRCFDECFKMWKRPLWLKESFRKEIYENQNWALSFRAGFFSGARILHEIEHLHKTDVAIFENLKKDFCIDKEMLDTNSKFN